MGFDARSRGHPGRQALTLRLHAHAHNRNSTTKKTATLPKKASGARTDGKTVRICRSLSVPSAHAAQWRRSCSLRSEPVGLVVQYKLTTTIMLALTTQSEAVGATTLCGNLAKQAPPPPLHTHAHMDNARADARAYVRTRKLCNARAHPTATQPTDSGALIGQFFRLRALVNVQTEKDAPYKDAASHICTIGQMIEAMENTVRPRGRTVPKTNYLCMP